MTAAMDEGLVLYGKYLSGRQEADKQGSDGKVYPGRYRVQVLVGDRVVSVEYRDEASATADVGAAVGSMDLVVLPVGVRSAKGYTFYFGRSA